MNYRMGADIGGTFTDFCLFDESSGQLLTAKVPSTPSHPSQAVMQGIEQFSDRHNVVPQDINYFVHGTTLGVNTLLQRKGAATGLLVTEGFRDIMGLGRSRLPDIFDLLVEKPVPLVSRRFVREIRERVMVDGTVRTPLNIDDVLREVGALIEEGIEALTVTFLHSYRYPEHEKMARDAIKKAYPDLFVCISSEIWPQIREYERTLVSAVNAYVGQSMGAYFTSLRQEVAGAGVQATLLSTKSNGGVMTALSASTMPVETLSSGPASGAIGAQFVASLSGYSKLIPLDMGGTSTEVAVIDESIRYAQQCHIGDLDISLPAVDLSSIGAGGGSIAWTDGAGVLKVGPESSGSDPGPACYGRSGTRPTITDAYVTMGIIDPEKFLGGEFPLHKDLAVKSVATIAEKLGYTVEQAAEAILRVATSNMYSELVPLMARKGVDVGDYALLCYGGGGATHGFMLAQEVGIRTVLVPHAPGTLCAFGALVADVKSDFIRSVSLTVEDGPSGEAMAQIAQVLRELHADALGWLESENIRVAEKVVRYGADMRHEGQSFEVAVELTGIDFEAPDAADLLRKAFMSVYSALYGDTHETNTLEIVNLRATAVGITQKPAVPKIREAALTGDQVHAPIARTRKIYLDGQYMDAAVYDRKSLTWGHQFEGPAIVEQYDTTAFIPPGFSCRVDGFGMIIGEYQS